jgi:starch synthase
LTDYIAQLLGNLPIVHRVGGLIKVVDGETGFSYADNAPATLAATMRQALAVFREQPERIKAMQQAAVERIRRLHTWDKVLDEYLQLYRQALRLAGREG